MNAVGKIGVLMPEIVDSMEYELLQGIHLQAKKLGYDVLVFTDTFNAIDEIYHDDYIGAQENIYELALNGSLDGILFAPERFHNNKVHDHIYEACKSLSVPCLILEKEDEDLPFIIAEQSEPVRSLTEHLIREHNCRKIYFLAGIQGNTASQMRLDGYCRAMEENGLPVDESMVFYGDFWTEKPRQLALDIASGKIPKPDAIVCASDIMAVALSDTLTENGISVPRDIAVTGYDGQWRYLIHRPSITTVSGREWDLGATAMCRLYEMMTAKSCGKPASRQHIVYGTSCGCTPSDNHLSNMDMLTQEEYVALYLNRQFERKNFMMSDYISNMTNVETIEELINKIDSLTFTIHGTLGMDICLCEDWMFDFEHLDKYRQRGFSEKMFLALSKRQLTMHADMAPFPTKDIILDLHEPHESMLAVLTCLHHQDQIFGYISFNYNDVKELFVDAHYLNWCDAIAGGLDTLQKKQYQEYIRQQLETLSVIDPVTGLYNKRGLMEQLSTFFACASGDFMCILISFVKKNNSAAQLGSEPELMIANALRLSSCENELFCRLQDNVFAVIFPFDNRNMEKLAQERLMCLEEKIHYIQGSMAQLKMPELITDCSLMQFEKLSTAERFIEEKIQFILEKCEAAELVGYSYKDHIYRIHREIHSSPQSKWNISDVAREIGISPTHFQRMYKAEFGVSFKDNVISERIHKAKKLLESTELRVQEISLACGYGDSSNFMRQFKDKVGMSALQYRKQNKV